MAAEVWARFGQCDRYIEPFFGSGAVLLANPYWQSTKEIVNDLDHHISNCWRAIRNAPDEVAYWCDYPCVEVDLHLWHIWLVNEGRERIRQCEWDDAHYDAEVAGKWLYGMANWIGGHFAIGTDGGWTKEALQIASEVGSYDLREINKHRTPEKGVKCKLPHLSNRGKGVNRQLPQSTPAENREFIHEFFPKNEGLYQYIRQLAARFIEVDVCCGDWLRILKPAVTLAGEHTTSNGTAAIFLDPPYSAEANRSGVYTQDDFSVAHAVRNWCIDNGNNPQMRIALAGYDVEHQDLEDHGWTPFNWSANGGYSTFANKGNQSHANKHREIIWFSPHCIGNAVEPLFGMEVTNG